MQAQIGMTLQADGAMGAGRPAARAARPASRAARAGPPRRVLRVRADALPAEESSSGGATHSTRRMFSLMSGSQAVGSHHGEGFVNFTLSGPLRVDVEQLNDQMKPQGALRLRHSQHPHEAFGLVFNFDSVVADLATIRREAWAQLAQAKGLPLPTHVLAHPELHRMPPEVAVIRLLRWANDRKAAVELALQHAELAGALLAAHNRPLEGVRDWLHTLGRFNVPCALVSALDRQTVQAALARMTLHDHFSAMVTAEDELETISQRLLTAAMKLGRPPNMSVFFDATPEGITAAHNVTFKAVAVQGLYPPHALRNADIACSSLSELSVINLRRLFANMGQEWMDLQKQAHDSNDDDAAKRRRRITNATL